MRKYRGSLTLLALGLLFITFALSQGQSGRPWHVTSAAMPTSLTSPVPLEGGTLTTTVDVNMLVISNQDSAAHTVTIEDCQSPTPFVLYNAVTVAAGQTWTVFMGGVPFASCFKWSASSALMQASATGIR